jgi:hypothetical protein
MTALILTLFSLILLPLNSFEAASIPFVVLGSISAGFALFSNVHPCTTKTARCILAFLFVCIVHVGWVVAGSVSTEEYLRGLAPFAFLAFYFVAARLITPKNFRTLYSSLIALGLAFATQNVVLLPKVISGEVWRSTFVNPNHSIPLPVVGFHLCVSLALRKQANSWHRIALMLCAAYMLLSSLLTGTRSLIVASLLPLFLLPLFQGVSFRQLFRYCSALAVLGVIALVLPKETLFKGARIGYTQAGSIDTRMQENEVALDHIERSPLIGNGLGFRFDTSGLYYQKTRVGYVHNSYLYILMDFGLFGLLYIAAPFFAIWRLNPATLGPYRQHAVGLILAVCGLMLFSLGFAMARLIQFNLLLGVLLAMAEALKRERTALSSVGTRGPVYMVAVLQPAPTRLTA